MNNMIHIDCEMGGRNLEYSLLTAYFMITDFDFNQVGELSLILKPDDGNYFVSGQGMAVNNINLQDHDKIAIPYKQAKSILYDFLKQYTNDGKFKLTPVGHAVKGDIAHIIKNLISEGSWEKFCTYHFIDTSVVLQFLRVCGKMPMDCDGSVSALAKHFFPNQSINDLVPGFLHDAKTDAQLTAKVFQEMIKLGKL